MWGAELLQVNTWRCWVCKTSELRGQNRRDTESCLWVPATASHLSFCLSPLSPSLPPFFWVLATLCVIVVSWGCKDEKSQCCPSRSRWSNGDRWLMSQWRFDLLSASPQVEAWILLREDYERLQEEVRRALSFEGRIEACQVVKEQGTHDRQREN